MSEYKKGQIDDIKEIFTKGDEINLEPELNIFSLITSQYHKENLNSDVIAGLLDTNSNPKDGKKLMESFLDCINKSISNNKIIIPKIDKKDFNNYEIKREENRIDILIKNKSTSSAIIIENKINNASDMDNQIPR